MNYSNELDRLKRENSKLKRTVRELTDQMARLRSELRELVQPSDETGAYQVLTDG